MVSTDTLAPRAYKIQIQNFVLEIDKITGDLVFALAMDFKDFHAKYLQVSFYINNAYYSKFTGAYTTPFIILIKAKIEFA